MILDLIAAQLENGLVMAAALILASNAMDSVMEIWLSVVTNVSFQTGEVLAVVFLEVLDGCAMDNVSILVSNVLANVLKEHPNVEKDAFQID